MLSCFEQNSCFHRAVWAVARPGSLGSQSYPSKNKTFTLNQDLHLCSRLVCRKGCKHPLCNTLRSISGQEARQWRSYQLAGVISGFRSVLLFPGISRCYFRVSIKTVNAILPQEKSGVWWTCHRNRRQWAFCLSFWSVVALSWKGRLVERVWNLR